MLIFQSWNEPNHWILSCTRNISHLLKKKNLLFSRLKGNVIYINIFLHHSTYCTSISTYEHITIHSTYCTRLVILKYYYTQYLLYSVSVTINILLYTVHTVLVLSVPINILLYTVHIVLVSVPDCNFSFSFVFSLSVFLSSCISIFVSIAELYEKLKIQYQIN